MPAANTASHGVEGRLWLAPWQVRPHHNRHGNLKWWGLVRSAQFPGVEDALGTHVIVELFQRGTNMPARFAAEEDARAFALLLDDKTEHTDALWPGATRAGA